LKPSSVRINPLSGHCGFVKWTEQPSNISFLP
jgi:hypothetical protein